MTPTAIVLSSAMYLPMSTANQLVGQLSTTDSNSCQTFTYTISAGGAVFSIANGNELRLTNANVTGNNLSVTVVSTDNGSPPLSVSATFTISEGEWPC